MTNIVSPRHEELLAQAQKLDWVASVKNNNTRLSVKVLAPLNEYYGIAEVIRRFLDSNELIYINWPHAIYQKQIKYLYDYKYLPLSAVYTREAMNSELEFSSKIIEKKLEPMGSFLCQNPFFMIPGIPNQKSIQRTDNSALVVLNKSTMKVQHTYNNDLESIETLVRELREKFVEVNALIFWVDHLNGGYQKLYHWFDAVFCSGHQFDKEFMFRQNSILRSHHSVFTFAIGTNIFYSLFSGNHVFLVRDQSTFRILDDGFVNEFDSRFACTIRFKDLWADEVFCTRPELLGWNNTARDLFWSFPGLKKYIRSKFGLI